MGRNGGIVCIFNGWRTERRGEDNYVLLSPSSLCLLPLSPVSLGLWRRLSLSTPHDAPDGTRPFICSLQLLLLMWGRYMCSALSEHLSLKPANGNGIHWRAECLCLIQHETFPFTQSVKEQISHCCLSLAYVIINHPQGNILYYFGVMHMFFFRLLLLIVFTIELLLFNCQTVMEMQGLKHMGKYQR